MSGFTEALDATTERYLTHFGKTAVALKAICDEAEIPLDASGVNAVAFTTYKATKDGYRAPAPQAAHGTEAPAPTHAPSGEKGRIMKLENAGDEAYITIASCDKAEGNFGPQYEFRGALLPDGENVRLFIGAAAVERQLAFLGMQATDIIGKTVQFSRAPNPKGKPFWNIAVKGAIKGKKAEPSNDFNDAPPPAAPDPFDLF